MPPTNPPTTQEHTETEIAKQITNKTQTNTKAYINKNTIDIHIYYNNQEHRIDTLTNIPLNHPKLIDLITNKINRINTILNHINHTHPTCHIKTPPNTSHPNSQTTPITQIITPTKRK